MYNKIRIDLAAPNTITPCAACLDRLSNHNYYTHVQCLKYKELPGYHQDPQSLEVAGPGPHLKTKLQLIVTNKSTPKFLLGHKDPTQSLPGTGLRAGTYFELCKYRGIIIYPKAISQCGNTGEAG